MASRTQITEKRRAAKKAANGKKRKNQLRNAGSTAANLPLNKPNANEKAQHTKKA